MNFSKSKYCGLWQCPKIAWLQKYKPEEMYIGDDVASRFAAGNEVGDLAMGIFGDYVEVTAYNGEKLDLSGMIANTPEEMYIGDDVASRFAAGNEVGDLAMGIFGDYVEVTAYNGEKLDLSGMIANTRAKMEKGTEVICEASFEYEGLYCAVDILKRENGGWAIYEVKSSTHDDKSVYYADVSYQKYVLENCGVDVTGTYLVCLNGDYVFDGELKLDELFRITDISDHLEDGSGSVEAHIIMARDMLESNTEPNVDLSTNCNEPYRCSFWKYCSRNLPSPSVFDLYRLQFKKKIALYSAGYASFESLENSGLLKNDKQLRQIDFALHDRGTFIDRENIKSFLNGLSYPLYFLDFETVQPVIPKYLGTKPYAQIPFQYSLHYIEREGGELMHKEFLAKAGTDPRRELAERLCEDIPMNVCVTAYNKDFECSRIKELAATFPDLAEHLLNIRDNIVDLLVPFQSGWYYNRAMGGSFSIKSVLPAIFPDDPELNYHNLEDIHNGSEAMNAFPAMEQMTPEEVEKTRTNLLKYCELDTYAMVKVWEELVRVTR